MTIKNTSGVYRITNTENGKRYYGSSKKLRKRWNDHKSMMRRGEHGNPGIKEDVAIHGEAAFDFQVLCYCKPEERKRLEGVLIDQNYGKDCYNDTKGDGAKGEETKAKLSAAHTGKILSEDHKAKIGAAHTGKTQSEETKAKKSAANKGKTFRKVSCPHCGLTGGVNAMNRWHFANCAHRQEQKKNK